MMLPFSGGIEETANATLVFSLAAALLYAVSPAPTRPRAKTAARIAAWMSGYVGQLLITMAFLLA